MITAHLPSGYVVARGLPRGLPHALPVALVAAVFPDLDLLFFYLVDGRGFHHHHYWVHLPAFWLALGVVAVPLAARAGYGRQAALFVAVVFLHLALDTVAGGVAWLWPVDDRLFTLAVVPARYGHWVLNFLFHWTFLLELAVWAWAGFLLIRRRA